MALSGVKVASQVNECVSKIQFKPKGNQKPLYLYITFKIDESAGEIVVDKYGDFETSTFDTFLADMQCTDANGNDDCRYAIYDLPYMATAQGCDAIERSSLLLVKYCPDTSKIKKKMLYSSSFDSLKKAFTAATTRTFQANGTDELTYDDMKAEIMRHLKT